MAKNSWSVRGLRNASLGFAANDYVRQHFTGYEADGETGLNFAQVRYHSSAQGRFTSVDPLGGSLGEPQSWNGYSYVLNSPPNFNDPTGLYASAEYGHDPNRDLDPFLHAASRRMFIDGFQVSSRLANALLETSAAAVAAPLSTTRWNPCGDGGFEFFRALQGKQPGWGNMRGHSVSAAAWVQNPLTGVFEFAGSVTGNQLFPDFTSARGSDDRAMSGILNVAGAGANIGRYYNHWEGAYWRGANGIRYSSFAGKGPNGSTGSRSLAISKAGAFGALGTVLGVGGMAISTGQGYRAYGQGDTIGVVKSSF